MGGAREGELGELEEAASAFPDPAQAPADGPFAAGGKVTPALLLDAYAHGIFPWFNSDREAVLWWSPDPRAVLAPTALHVSKSLAKRLRRGGYRVTADAAFAAVIAACAAPRPGQAGTWITRRMIDGYTALHRLGYAHSVEVWEGGALVGGLYGISLGRMFFGESMFSAARDASKVALAHLGAQLAAWRFTLIDCQIMNDHLHSLGARPLPRQRFLKRVAANRRCRTRRGKWTFDPHAPAPWRR